MRGFACALVVAFAITSGCGTECKTRSDCELGQFCEFTRGECRDGCRSNADCGRVAVCEVSTGVCRSARFDAGMPDAGTSSVADAGG